MAHSLRYLANCSMLFTELPLLQRPAAAAEAGFDAIELWWPFAEPVPPESQIDELVQSITDARVTLVGLNFYAGDLAGPDCGALSVPDAQARFRDNVPVAVEIGRRLGVRAFNALYGNRVDNATRDEQDCLATENLVLAARAAATIGATVLIEPISGPKPYPLRTAADAAAVVDRVRAREVSNIAVLFDVYHLASNGDDVVAALDAHAAAIGHVQVADAPGRGEPGTGTSDIDGWLERLQAHGYDGWVGLEYKPTTTTLESLAWLPRERRRSREELSR